MQDMARRIVATAHVLVGSPGFQVTLQQWADQYAALRTYGRPENILNSVRTAPYSVRDAHLAALVSLVQGGDQDAGLVLLSLLCPGITARARRLGRSRDPEEAWQEVAAGALWAARRYDATHYPTGIARNLLAWAARRARRQLPARSSAEIVMEPPEVGEDPPDLESNQVAVELIARAVAERVINEAEAQLIWRTRIDGYLLRETAPNEPPDRVRKRRRRAEQRLRQFLEAAALESVRSEERTGRNTSCEGPRVSAV